uniref:C2H2-type domain-containing protein n=1 Tax=Heterorhabditis bacteriophora TaxID=37862 RepID=A0A1I7XTX7_HETBA
MLINVDVDVEELSHNVQNDIQEEDQTPTSSSTPLVEPMKAHDISGWEEVVDFYSANNTWTSKEKQGININTKLISFQVLVINQGRHRNKFTVDFKDHIEDVIRTENVPLRLILIVTHKFVFLNRLCALCDTNCAHELPSNFRNDISMRMFVLRHFCILHNDIKGMSEAVKSEWDILSKEIGYDLTSFGYPQKQLEQTNRHSEVGEFREVSEIAQEALPSASNFPFVTLRYSKVYQVYDIDDSNSLEFFKWRCVLPSCEVGHTDDVLEFPSATLLKMHALRHFEKYHAGLFTEKFFEFEWNLIRNDTKLELDIRSYCPLSQGTGRGPSLDITDPNDFVLPCQLQILPRSAQHLKVCGFCYWTGLPTQFLDHVPIHGYFDEGIPLVSNSNRAALSDWLYKKVSYHSFKLGSAPITILGNTGKQIARILRRKDDGFTLKDFVNGLSSTDNVDSCSTNSDISIADTSVQQDNERMSLETMNTPNNMENLQFKAMSASCSEGNFSVGKANLKDAAVSVYSHSTTTISNSQTESVNGSNVSLEDVETPTSNDSSKKDIIQLESIRIKSNEQKIHAKFSWTGPPPAPFTSVHISQLSAMSRNECPFCISNSGKRLRMAGLASSEMKEETMIAHLVIYHSEDNDAKLILAAKRYRISLDKMERPLKFLLQPASNGGLLCSSCEIASFPKISNLRLHWSRCVAVEGRIKCIRNGKPVLDFDRTPNSGCETKRQQNSSVACPLSRCVSAWKRSFIYPNGVGQVSHLISSHSTDKEAFETAVTIGMENNLADVFPFLDVVKSFANFIEDSHMLRLQCSKCHLAFGSPYELAQHAKRYHPTDEHYSGMPKCPFGCSFISRRKLAMAVSDSVLRLLHIIKIHLPDQEAVEWLLKRDFNSIMENEPYYKIDVQKSVEETLANVNRKPLIHCLSCGVVVDAHAFVEHRRRTCDSETNHVSHNATELIRNSNNKLVRLQQSEDVETPNTHKARKRTSEKCQYVPH